MRGTKRTILAVVLNAALCALVWCSAYAQTPATNGTSTPSSWEEYVADLKPNLEQGRTGLAIDPKFWDKYNEMLIDWTGRLKECRTSRDKEERERVSCDVLMPGQKIAVRGGPAGGMTIESINVSLDSIEGSRWQALSAGERIRFRARTLSTVVVFPAKTSGAEPLVGILLSDGHLVSVGAGDRRTLAPQASVPPRTTPRSDEASIDKPVALKRPAHVFKVGERVKLPTTRQQRVRDIEWALAMDGFVGAEAVVTKVDPDQTVQLDVDNGTHWWAFEWLTPVRPK